MSSDTNRPEKSYSTYRRLLWTLGMVGAHHYYTGNIGRGLLYTCTIGGCTVLWIKDLVNPRRDFNREMMSQGVFSARTRG